jgi:hypothetical protein
MTTSIECYLCSEHADLTEANQDFYRVDCGACGEYTVQPETARAVESGEMSCTTETCERVREWLRANPGQTINSAVLAATSE